MRNGSSDCLAISVRHIQVGNKEIIDSAYDMYTRFHAAVINNNRVEGLIQL